MLQCQRFIREIRMEKWSMPKHFAKPDVQIRSLLMKLSREAPPFDAELQLRAFVSTAFSVNIGFFDITVFIF
jgi:hypothetical protein